MTMEDRLKVDGILALDQQGRRLPLRVAMVLWALASALIWLVMAATATMFIGHIL